jgi:hypothetical protein
VTQSILAAALAAALAGTIKRLSVPVCLNPAALWCNAVHRALTHLRVMILRMHSNLSVGSSSTAQQEVICWQQPGACVSASSPSPLQIAHMIAAVLQLQPVHSECQLEIDPRGFCGMQ